MGLGRVLCLSVWRGITIRVSRYHARAGGGGRLGTGDGAWGMGDRGGGWEMGMGMEMEMGWMGGKGRQGGGGEERGMRSNARGIEVLEIE